MSKVQTALIIFLFFSRLVSAQDSTRATKSENISFNFELADGNYLRIYNQEQAQNLFGIFLGGIEVEKHLYQDISIYAESSLIMAFQGYECFDNCDSEVGWVWSLASGFKKGFNINERNVINVAAGLSANYYYWRYDFFENDSLAYVDESKSFDNWGFGFNLDVSYFFKLKNKINAFGAGFNYSPTFINTEGIGNKYLHVINMKLIYRLSTLK